MPASKEYVKALQIKRLERVRPKVKLPLVPATDASNISYIFDHIKVAKSRIASTNALLSITIVTLDDGRISFADAIKFFSWDDSTRLECKVEAGALVITAIPQGELRLANSQGRIRLPLSARKLLGWSNGAQLIVVTRQEPAPSVVVYDSAEAIQIIEKQRNNHEANQ